ncbi:2471_t:CDS:2, partial [Dentiscutata erythropus]
GQIEILETSKGKYNYNNNFAKEFKFAFCSSYNSKWYCVGKAKSKVEPNNDKHLDNTLENNNIIDNAVESTTTTSYSSSQANQSAYKAADSYSSDYIGQPIEDLLSDGVEELENDIHSKFDRYLDDEYNNDKEEFLFKRVNILAESCDEFRYQILSKVRLQLDNFTITQDNYVLSYKIAKESGAGTQIFDENDFKSFVKDYNNAINKKKEIFINVQIQKILKNNPKKRLYKSNPEELSSDDNSTKKQPKLFGKKPKVSYLDDERHIISQIREKYYCANCEGSCWPTETGHIKLSGMHYTTWARAISNGIADINTPPCHAIFTLPPKPRGTSSSNQLSSNLNNSFQNYSSIQSLTNFATQPTNYFSTQPITNSSTQLPTNISNQIPTSLSSQLLANLYTQLPTNLPTQLPTNLSTRLPNNLSTQLPNSLSTQSLVNFLSQPPPINLSSQPLANFFSQSPNIPLQLLPNVPLQTLSNSSLQLLSNNFLPNNFLPNNFLPYYIPFPVIPNLQSSNTSTLQESVTTKSIPSLKEFLTEVEDAGGEILACLPKFQDQGIRIKWISRLTDDQFKLVGIEKSGWQIALQEASKEYTAAEVPPPLPAYEFEIRNNESLTQLYDYADVMNIFHANNDTKRQNHPPPIL